MKNNVIQKKNGIVVVGAIFVDIKGFPQDIYVPDGRNAGYIEYIHGGVARNVVEDIANLGLNSTFVSIVAIPCQHNLFASRYSKGNQL